MTSADIHGKLVYLRKKLPMGMFFVLFLWALWITYRIGNEDGNWGCFIVLIIPTIILLIIGDIS